MFFVASLWQNKHTQILRPITLGTMILSQQTLQFHIRPIIWPIVI